MWIGAYCQSCDPCTARKGPTGQSKAPLQQYQVGAPMDRVAVDILGPFPRTLRGNRYVVVALDYFTKWPETVVVPDQEAATVCEVLIEGMFSRFGVPTELHSNQGRNFEAQLFMEMCKQLGIRKTRTTPLHPQSDRLVERFNHILVVAKDQKDWDLQLPLVLMACGSATQETNGCTSALLMFGRELRTPPTLAYGRPPDTPQVPAGPEYATQLRERVDLAYKFARKQAETTGARQKRAYDQHTKEAHFNADDLVWVYAPKRIKGKSPKLQSNWIGPCRVLERLGEVVYRVKLAGQGRVVVIHCDRPLGAIQRNEPAKLPAESSVSSGCLDALHEGGPFPTAPSKGATVFFWRTADGRSCYVCWVVEGGVHRSGYWLRSSSGEGKSGYVCKLLLFAAERERGESRETGH